MKQKVPRRVKTLGKFKETHSDSSSRDDGSGGSFTFKHRPNTTFDR